MSKYQLKKTIEKEIKDLNWRIDMKIVRGISYRNEARRHKLLLMQLNRLAQAKSYNFLGKMAGSFATFMF